MSDSDDKIALPKRISETGTKGVVLERINKRSNLKLVGKVENLLGKEFKNLEDSFLAPVIKMGRRQKNMAFSRHLIHHLLLRRIDIGKKGLWRSDLVEDVDCEFGRVVDLVKRGYRLKRQDWLNGSVDIVVAEAEVDENNSVPGIDATDQEKIEFLTKKVVSLEERIKYLEGLLNIRGETVKVNGQNADYELDETKLLQDYIDAKRKEIAKRNKNGVRPPREVDHQDEDDTDVEVNEEQPQEVEEQQEEDDTAVDVDVSDKESENPETIEGQTREEEEQHQEDDTEVNIDVDDGEVNEDASEKPVKGTKKRGRETKDGEVNEDASEKHVKCTKKRGRGIKINISLCIMDAEVNEDASEKPVKGTKKSKRGTKDGEVNEDASEKPVKGTKKRGRGTKGKKKGVTSPREVEDDAEVDAKETENPKTNEEGEVNEDASKKNVKGTKKCARVTKKHREFEEMKLFQFFSAFNKYQ
ncbi:hypothetical protein YC2023_117890 [Brassica napus]